MAPLFNWLNERAAGVLLHPSSLPGGFGIGNLGAPARRFVDFLSAGGFKVWQICPLGPTGYGDSPYQSFSAFAGNPYFIDLEPLVEAGLVAEAEADSLRALPGDFVDYGQLYRDFWPVLRKAYGRFHSTGADSFADYGPFEAFRARHSFWLDDFTRFTALKESFGGKPWTKWPQDFRFAREVKPGDLDADARDAAGACAFYQYVFFGQLAGLRRYAAERGVRIMGDLPIFVAMDSADVWSNPALFQLKADGKPKRVAGVPPDYFSADGQLWGNPLYDWEKHEETGFDWWIQRVRCNLEFYDIVRLDHFRGFESFWSVPGTAKTAKNGRWVPSPGRGLFEALHGACPEAKLVAEDLGVITDKVAALREHTGLPGMAVMHFAFGGDAGNPYLPHNYKPNLVAYAGTHDNDTTLGWYGELDPEERDHLRRYLAVSGEEVNWDLFRAAVRSTARLAIVPLQDLLNLGSEARLNRPGSAEGNWQWRFAPDALDGLEASSGGYLRDLLALYGR